MKAWRDEDTNVIRMSTVEGQYFVDSNIPKYSKDVPSSMKENDQFPQLRKSMDGWK